MTWEDFNIILNKPKSFYFRIVYIPGILDRVLFFSEVPGRVCDCGGGENALEKLISLFTSFLYFFPFDHYILYVIFYFLVYILRGLKKLCISHLVFMLCLFPNNRTNVL